MQCRDFSPGLAQAYGGWEEIGITVLLTKQFFPIDTRLFQDGFHSSDRQIFPAGWNNRNFPTFRMEKDFMTSRLSAFLETMLSEEMFNLARTHAWKSWRHIMQPS